MQPATDDHRLLLQYFISHKVIAEDKIQQHFPKTRFEELVHGININLQNMHLEIKRIIAEEDGSVFWGIVNLKNDELSQIATNYNKVEVDLFKAILDKLASEGQMLYLDAIEVNPHMSRDKAENIILKFVDDKWLTRDGGELVLGLRARLELRPYLEEVFGEEMKECVFCTEIVFKGETCENDRCSTVAHRHCAQRWFAEKPNPKCPTCSEPWEDE
uniref:Non-structural maintenance of chromosomes element 1 homolog n=1 Tax=Vannella robusta TaxID=1487602 RepID=A0A7S4MBR1_9EUKA|mmetsp:Transcript_17846/g.22682  ORF Transcript_17846/g.22682 Transcript_17846/m.22682 type:complete len:216 (+) Transcript_17846:1-648(+)